MSTSIRRTRLWHAERAESIRSALKGMSGIGTLPGLKARQRLIARAHTAISAAKTPPRIEPGKSGFDAVSAPYWTNRLLGYEQGAVG